MTFEEVMSQLEALGTAQNRKVYPRHGVRGELFGVSYADLGKLQKKIKRDHELARALWASGNHDARVLATKVADPAAMTSRELDAWARDLDNYILMDALAALAAASPLAFRKIDQWTRRKGEFVCATGWTVLAHQAPSDPAFTDEQLEGYLRTVEEQIHGTINRVRHSMNGALIAIGLRDDRFQELAIAAAERIGKVEVDHGDTSCKTPDAVSYIRKAAARRRKS